LGVDNKYKTQWKLKALESSNLMRQHKIQKYISWIYDNLRQNIILDKTYMILKLKWFEYEIILSNKN